ncbi:hypothetical protein EAE99_011594 [Botrytis elliptica]|nr:hypothetical protein EAE99_011594 [Botrytis elliptica]
MEGVTSSILNQSVRIQNDRVERRICNKFVRIGPPRSKVTLAFESIKYGYPAVMANFSATAGYLEMNTLLGVIGKKDNYVYKDYSMIIQHLQVKKFNITISIERAIIAIPMKATISMQKASWLVSLEKKRSTSRFITCSTQRRSCKKIPSVRSEDVQCQREYLRGESENAFWVLFVLRWSAAVRGRPLLYYVLAGHGRRRLQAGHQTQTSRIVDKIILFPQYSV